MNLRSLSFFFFLSVLLISSLHVLGEGTKQFRPAESDKGYICISTGRNDFFWNGGATNYRLWIHISDHNTESIYFGFGAYHDGASATTYYIYRPDGSVIKTGSVPTSGNPGFINSWQEAVDGPSVIAPTTGYSALNCAPDVDGDYYIACTQSGGTEKSWENFDVTVVNTTTMTAINGRLWSKAWQIYCDMPQSGSENKYWGKMFVYSLDSIVTKIDFNGMIPGTFTVSCNESGCFQVTPLITADSARKSVANEHTYPEYKIFLNNPDSTVYPSGTIGGLDLTVPVTSVRNCDGSVDFTFRVTKAGNVDLHLVLSTLPGYNDYTIPQAVTTGYNTVHWDGLDGSTPRKPVPNGSTFPFYLSYINGLTHLPLYDVEFNQNGFKVNLVRPTATPPYPDPLFYWDDRKFGAGLFNLTGCASTPITGCHTWTGGSSGFGNNRTINTWWYAVSTSTANISITENRRPDDLGPITGSASFCPGVTGAVFSVATNINATSYEWSYSGTGATINNNGNNIITIDFSPAATSGVLTVVGHNDPCGNSINPSSITITINPFPVVAFDPIAPVCIDAPAFIITGGSPAGGTYFIGGTAVTTFDPAANGVGSVVVTYYYTEPTSSCTSTINQTIVVNPLPTVNFLPMLPVCISQPPFALSAGTPSGGTYSGPGVTGGVFSPATAGVGTHTLTYTFADANSCTNSHTGSITVNPLPVVSLAPLADVCVTTASFALTGGTPPGGTYTGAGVTGGLFNPALAGVGTFTITYTYTDANTCTSSGTNSITVTPLPAAAGAIAGPLTLCQSTTTATFTIPPIPNATSYTWVLSPVASGIIAGTSTTATVTWNPAFYGSYSITVTGVNSCGNGTTSAPLAGEVMPSPTVTYTICSDSISSLNGKPIRLRGGIPLGGTYSGAGVNSGTSTFNPFSAGLGSHSIRYTFTNSFGCTGFINKTFTVINPIPHTCGNKFTDVRDNKQYNTIMVGTTQCWMAENLNYGNYIANAQVQRDNCIIEKYCYGNSLAACSSDGGLYQWDEMMMYDDTPGIQGLCPPGMHVPTETEWTLLFSNFINNGFAGSPLKSTGWSGFMANVDGVNHFTKYWNFVDFATMFWTSNKDGDNKAYAHGLNTPDPSVSLYPSFRANGFSVRCLKD